MKQTRKLIMVWIIMVLIAGLVIVFLAGPRIMVDQTIRPIHLPDDLDAYLKDSEARFTDIIPNTEKTIIWADPSQKQQTSIAIIYLHGFAASRQETAPLAEMVAKALGANLFYTRLTGHGRTGAAMGAATVNDWLNDAVEAMEIGRRLGEKVLVIGVSTGGTLATWLAASQYADDLLACVLISPNFLPAKGGSKFLWLPWSNLLVRLMTGETWSWKSANELHGTYWITSHPSNVLLQMMALVRLARTVDHANIQSPVLFIFSTKDEVVNPHETEKFYERFGSPIKQKVYIDHSQDPKHHVLAGDILSPNTTEEIVRIIVAFTKGLNLPRSYEDTKKKEMEHG